MRLDKFLAEMSVGSRSEVKGYIRKGQIAVNGEIVKDAGMQVSPETDRVEAFGREVAYARYEYYMLHKPAGYITATRDRQRPVVMDLLTDTLRKDLFPIGRLDVDTEGLLLITNDGELAKNLLSPAHHVEKTYYARICGVLDDASKRMLQEGMDIGEKHPTKPAKLRIISQSPTEGSEVELTITEGKYHQVKRMFAGVGTPVAYLRRISMGSLHLDEHLKTGAYRALTEQEVADLRKAGKSCKLMY